MILATNKNFLLGVWLEEAKSLASESKYQKADSALYEFNARNQITLWGPNGEILDYAAKQWSGLFSSYYAPRWILFFATLESSLMAGNNTFDAPAFRKKFIDEIGTPFTKDRSSFPTEPHPGANPIATAIKMFERWLH